MTLLRITTPSRLHFGLWSLHRESGRQFGGVGAMVEQPGLVLTVEPAAGLSAGGPLAERALAAARRWAEFHQSAVPNCRLTVERAPPEHVGLGTGTQLELAVAAALSALAGLPGQSPVELALSVGRGRRSAVGTYGFAYGGLIVEQGKLPGEPVSPLDCRIDLPAAWRFVLVRQLAAAGLAGADEARAIAALGSVPQAVTDEMIALARDALVPGAATADFALFSRGVYRYGRLAGECFAACQGGPFNGPGLTELVAHIHALGFEGVGQSSWGPTLFVVAPEQQAAEDLAARLRDRSPTGPLEVLIAAPDNRGARLAGAAPRPPLPELAEPALSP